MQAPGSVHKLNYLQHREEKVAADLALIAGLLSNSRENGTIGDMGASYNTQVSMKMASKTMSAKMSTTSMMRRTARSKCKWLSLLQLAAVSSCVSVVCLLACLFLPVCLAHDPATKLPCDQNTIQIEIALSLAFYVHDITRRQTQTRDFGISACTVEFSWLLERGIVTEGRLAPLP